MTVKLDVDSANTLIRYAKAYVDPNISQELYRMVKIEIDGVNVTATMLTRHSTAVCRLHATNVSADHEVMFIRTPLTLFKKSDDFVTIEDTETETVYTTARGRTALPKVDADYSKFMQTEQFFKTEPLATVYFDGDLLARSLACMGKPVMISFLGELNGVRLTSREGDTIVLPINPNKARKELE